MGVTLFLLGVIVGAGLHYASMIYFIKKKETPKTLGETLYIPQQETHQTGVWRDKEYKGLEHSQE